MSYTELGCAVTVFPEKEFKSSVGDKRTRQTCVRVSNTHRLHARVAV